MTGRRRKKTRFFVPRTEFFRHRTWKKIATTLVKTTQQQCLTTALTVFTTQKICRTTTKTNKKTWIFYVGHGQTLVRQSILMSDKS